MITDARQRDYIWWNRYAELALPRRLITITANGPIGFKYDAFTSVHMPYTASLSIAQDTVYGVYKRFLHGWTEVASYNRIYIIIDDKYIVIYPKWAFYASRYVTLYNLTCSWHSLPNTVHQIRKIFKKNKVLDDFWDIRWNKN